MWQGLKVAVVIPAFNEALCIERMLRGLPEFVDHAIVVDDASSDETLRVVKHCQLQRETLNPRIEVLVHAQNLGVGRAIADGYKRGLALGADCLIVMGGDGQMAPQDLPLLIAPIAHARAHYVKGNRFIHASWRCMPRHRRWGGRFLALLTARTTALPIGDSQCGYTAISAEAAQALPLSQLWPRFGYPNDLLGMLSRLEATVVEVPVAAIYADEKSGIRWYHLAVVTFVILRRAWHNRFKFDPSSVGERFTLRGLAPELVPSPSRLAVQSLPNQPPEHRVP